MWWLTKKQKQLEKEINYLLEKEINYLDRIMHQNMQANYWKSEYLKRTLEVRSMHRTINRLHRRLVRGRTPRHDAHTHKEGATPL